MKNNKYLIKYIDYILLIMVITYLIYDLMAVLISLINSTYN